LDSIVPIVNPEPIERAERIAIRFLRGDELPLLIDLDFTPKISLGTSC
jgi:hypothetical protein